jgi:hypothetical protein
MPGQRGRPPLSCPITTIHITLNLRGGDDDDLRHFFEVIPPRRRAMALKTALRAGGVTIAAGNTALDDDLSEAAASLLFG